MYKLIRDGKPNPQVLGAFHKKLENDSKFWFSDEFKRLITYLVVDSNFEKLDSNVKCFFFGFLTGGDICTM